ncbi:MAG: sulfur carrier protein ThiS [Gemmatimonadaceae bacterium]
MTVNGEARNVESGSTLGDLLREHELDPRMVVVERNRVIERDRDEFDQMTLEADDVLEIVHFVGGG